eukprot:6203324-Pleurochrysis_carterae.AAC.1
MDKLKLFRYDSSTSVSVGCSVSRIGLSHHWPSRTCIKEGVASHGGHGRGCPELLRGRRPRAPSQLLVWPTQLQRCATKLNLVRPPGPRASWDRITIWHLCMCERVSSRYVAKARK